MLTAQWARTSRRGVGTCSSTGGIFPLGSGASSNAAPSGRSVGPCIGCVQEGTWSRWGGVRHSGLYCFVGVARVVAIAQTSPPMRLFTYRFGCGRIIGVFEQLGRALPAAMGSGAGGSKCHLLFRLGPRVPSFRLSPCYKADANRSACFPLVSRWGFVDTFVECGPMFTSFATAPYTDQAAVVLVKLGAQCQRQRLHSACMVGRE